MTHRAKMLILSAGFTFNSNGCIERLFADRGFVAIHLEDRTITGSFIGIGPSSIKLISEVLAILEADVA